MKKKYHNYGVNEDTIGYNILSNNFIKGKRCTYCGNRKTHYFDSLGFLYHDISKMIVEDKRNNLTWENMYLISPHSNKLFYFKCLKCGAISNKPLQLNSIIYYKYSCKYCSDGVSIPEKFTTNLLKCLNLSFETQAKFNWSNNKRYDFYIPSLNMIIETHGKQHYEESNWISSKTRTLEEERENDKYKKELALVNGIKKYIVIDCRYSTFEWLKENITKELNNILDLDNVDWGKIWLNCQNSLVIQTWDLWNKGLRDTKKISEILNLSLSTVINYLKLGTSIKTCDYNKSITIQTGNNKKKGGDAYNSVDIICITTKRIFHSVSDACKYYGTSGIYQHLKKKK